MKLNEQNYVSMAEEVITRLNGQTNRKNNKRIGVVTTSKLRSLLAMTADIYNEVINIPGDTLNEEIQGRISYLKVRFIYEAGRDRELKVKALVQEGKILEYLDEIKGSKKQFILFSRYMEALVAYRKYICGQDE